MGFFGGLAVLEPVTAFAGGDHVFPLVGAPAGDRQNMIAGELATTELSAAVEAAMVITPKQSAVTQWRCEVVHHPALKRNDGLQNDL